MPKPPGRDLRVAGRRFSLRPVGLNDVNLILALRGDPERARFLHATPLTVAAQVRYLEDYFRRDNDYYFVIEGNDPPRSEGLIGVYDIDWAAGRGEWGRWILRRGSSAAVESVLLLYRFSFGCLGLKELYCRTLADNARVVSFHDSCGLTRRGETMMEMGAGLAPALAVEHVLDAATWPLVDRRLAAFVRA
jgi:RimJ/RimL family protein N-acetyltransferase